MFANNTLLQPSVSPAPQAYIYTLYSSHYQFDMDAIAMLFIVGFGSSLIVGTYVGMPQNSVLQRTGICYVSLASRLTSQLMCLKQGRYLQPIPSSSLCCLATHSHSPHCLVVIYIRLIKSFLTIARYAQAQVCHISGNDTYLKTSANCSL